MGEAPWLDTAEQQVWRALVTVHSRLLARLDGELQDAHQLPLADYEVLVHLSEAPGGSLRMAELAQRLLLSPSGLTRRLDGLVRQGMVERRSCPSDRRGSFAVLTEAGLERLETAAPTHVAGVRRYVIDCMGREELLALGRSLEAIGCRLASGPPGVSDECPGAMAAGPERCSGDPGFTTPSPGGVSARCPGAVTPGPVFSMPARGAPDQ